MNANGIIGKRTTKKVFVLKVVKLDLYIDFADLMMQHKVNANLQPNPGLFVSP